MQTNKKLVGCSLAILKTASKILMANYRNFSVMVFASAAYTL
jgi:hypothetical protein